MSSKFAYAIAALGLAAAATSSSAAPQFFGPTPYLSAADSPIGAAGHVQFYLEDFEDGLLNTPGLSATGVGQLCVSNEAGCFLHSGLEDSVGNGGDGNVGHSLFAGGGSITLTFDASVLGALPTAAGLVWTDGDNPIVFDAYGPGDVFLGEIVGNSADVNFSGGTAEDRFYGLTNAAGISKLVISDQSGLEIDHVQYGVDVAAPRGTNGGGGVPEPAAWALMLVGFFGAGGMLRARRRLPAIHPA
jgi:hypothetical protein